MTPLNPFPELLTYSLAAPLIIRLALGSFYIFWGGKELQDLWEKGLRNSGTLPWWTSRVSVSAAFLGGVLVLVGWYTQIGAIVLTAASLLFAYNEPKNRLQFLLLAAMALSLLVSGAGFFGLDMPL